MGTDPKHLLGTTLSGRYQIEKVIGEGGMGAVFQAKQLSLGRLVAIKVVKCAHGDDSDAIRRFELETEVIARLAHPNIVQVVDAGRSEDGTMFLAMELLEGENVRGLLRKSGAFSVARALAVVEDVASALSAAHAGGVIHRDLKAENVMLVRAAGKQEIAKVLDFGVAKLTSKTEAPPQTGSGFVAGTPGCIAPEQMLGKSDDPRSDLYSVGVLMFEMLSGVAPFTSTSSVELMMRHLTEPAPRVSDVARARGLAEIPQAVDDLVAALLAKDPDIRPASAEALVEIVVSMRDASRATQADLRLLTPQGGFGLPTPGSMSVPTMPAPTPQVAVHAPTAPTTMVPVPSPARLSPRKIAPRIAAMVALGGLLVFFAMKASAIWADRAIANWDGEAWQAFNAAVNENGQFMNLDVEGARRNLELVVHRNPDVPIAHLLLAHVAMLEQRPLTRIDDQLKAARAAAERRSTATMQRTHTQRLVDVLTEIDPTEARAKWARHTEEGGCFDVALETQLFASKMAMFVRDGELVERLFTSVAADVEDLKPATVLGLARARRFQGRYDEATKLLEDLLVAQPLNPIIVDGLVNIDVARGDDKKAKDRLNALLRADIRAIRPALRSASLGSQTDPRAYDRVLGVLRGAVDGNVDKVDGLAFIGHQYASRGRFAEADAIWTEAIAAAAEDETRAAEVAVFAAMYGSLGGDVELAKKWTAVYGGALLDPKALERLQPFHIANRIMIAARSGKLADPRVRKDFDFLMMMKTDIPILPMTVRWHALMNDGKHQEALDLAPTLGNCFGGPLVGPPLLALGKTKEALAAFVAATTPARELECTTGDDSMPYISSLLFAEALASRAQVAMQLGDRAEAKHAVDRFRAFWPYASTGPGPAAASVATVAAVEVWLKP